MRIKDPQDVLDYGRDWSDWLADGETISSHTVTPTGVTVDSSSIVGTQVVAWCSGGTNGDLATLRFHITTSAGRQHDRTLKLLLRER
jgi:hypothetical protein